MQEKERKDRKINLVVRTNIRKALKGKIENVAEEVESALNEKVHELLEKGIERAKLNQRKTLQARDL
jgi:histone H3/H4